MKNEEARIAALNLAQQFKPLSVDELINQAKAIEQYILGIGTLKAELPKVDFTAMDAQLFVDSMKSIAVFAKHLKILHPQYGLIPFVPNEDQLAVFDAWENNSRVFLDMDRQNGTTTALMAAILHEAVFREHRTTVFMATKLNAAKEYRKILGLMIEHLPPKWAKLIVNNQLTVELDNGSMILFTGSKIDSIRGRAISNLVVDQAGFISNADADYLSSALLPVICGGKSHKLIYATTGYEGDRSELVKRLREDPEVTKVVRRIG